MSHKYLYGLDKVEANYQALTPISFLKRSAQLYPDKIAIIHGAQRFTYKEFEQNVNRLASALKARGVKKGKTVSIMAANIPAFLDAHFAVPMIGAVLNSLNTRLEAQALAFILDHAECEVLLTDTAYYDVMRKAVALSTRKRKRLVIDISDPEFSGGKCIGEIEYQDLLQEGSPAPFEHEILDEWEAMALNYTSGTTGNPKGVVYSHRGAYLNSIGNNMIWPVNEDSVYLWTLPMFHCNGWCFPWTVTAMGATHVCLRSVEVEPIISAFANHNVTHFCGAPIVLNMILNADQALQSNIPRDIKAMTAGAPPPAAVIKGMEKLGFEITQGYGLTEVYGPCVVSQWKHEWDELESDQRAALKARQGIRYPTQEDCDVLDPDTMEVVPADGVTIGEIMFRGNTTMKGYLKNQTATEDAFADGWFHSGDLAVKHPDNYIEIKDRSKDIIISGGENISSVEIEGLLYRHPAVMEAAVVAKKDDVWGETPCAFISVKEGHQLTEEEIITFCRSSLAGFKCPKNVVFMELPKTSTGKIQKFLLREQVEILDKIGKLS